MRKPSGSKDHELEGTERTREVWEERNKGHDGGDDGSAERRPGEAGDDGKTREALRVRGVRGAGAGQWGETERRHEKGQHTRRVSAGETPTFEAGVRGCALFR